MGTKLSVTTGARRLLLRSLAITAMLVVVFAITASGASAGKTTPGIWTVGPGKTLGVVEMRILAHDLDTAYVCVDMMPCQMLGNNAGHQDGSPPGFMLPDFFYMNGSNTTHTVTLELHDATAGCDSFSTGANALATRLRESNHNAEGQRELLSHIDINDGETHPGCRGVPYGPFGDSSAFDGIVIIPRTP
jgi:hypothetical protein